MRDFMKKYFLLFCLAVSAFQVQAQSIPTVDLNGLKAHMLAQGETLTVYNFWATWCRPCVAELPYFEQLNQEYADKGVKVVFASLDFPDQYDRMVAMTQKKNLQSELLHVDEADQNALINGISHKWSGALPATVIVGPGVYTFQEKSFTYEELTEWVDSILENLEE